MGYFVGFKRFVGVGRSLSSSLFRQLITCAVIFQITFGTTLGMAADSGFPSEQKNKGYSVFLPPELQKLSSEDYLKSSEQFNDTEKLFIEKYFNEPARVTLDLMILARALAEKAESIDNVVEKIKSRDQSVEVAVEIPGIGKAEFNSLGYKDHGKPFTRFVHYGTQTSYVFLDSDIVPLEELTQEDKEKLGVEAAINEERERKESRAEASRYIALQQMHTKVHPDEYNPFPNLEEINPEIAKNYLEELNANAKKNPPKKRYDTGSKIKTGRLVKVISYSGKAQIVKSLKEYQRYEDLSPLQRVAIYWKSVKQGTRLNWDYWDHGGALGKAKGIFTGDVLVGIFSTVMQTGIFMALKGFDVDPLSVILVSGWAFSFSITPTIRNWINVNGNKSSILFKSFLNSVLFNYIMLIAIHGSDVVFSMNAQSFNMFYLAITNAIINNFGKVWWYKIPQIRQRAGLNLKEVNVMGLKTKVDQSSFEQQAWYLGSNIFRTADLLAMGTLFTIMSIEFTASRLAMLLTIPTMHFLIMKYAEKNDFKEKKLLRDEWEKANYLHWKNELVLLAGHKIPIFYLGSAKMFAKETWTIAKSSAMLLYWPGKVAFDMLKGAGDYLVKRFNSASQDKTRSHNPNATPFDRFESERSNTRSKAPIGISCKSVFS